MRRSFQKVPIGRLQRDFYISMEPSVFWQKIPLKLFPSRGGLCRNFKSLEAQAEGHSLGIMRQWFCHGSRRAENQIFPLSDESAFPLRRHGGKCWIASSPADASSFMPSLLGYDTVSGGRGLGHELSQRTKGRGTRRCSRVERKGT
jgi:hypothetical protein